MVVSTGASLVGDHKQKKGSSLQRGKSFSPLMPPVFLRVE